MSLRYFFSDIRDALQDIHDAFEKPKQFAPGTSHKARWLPVRKLLKPNFQGFNLGGRCISKADSLKHCLVYGPSGSGKSSMILVNSIFTMSETSSLVIHDPSGELWARSSGYLQTQGIIVKRLAFDFVREGFNPLRYMSNRSDLNSLAERIITTALGNNVKDPFWNERGIDLLQMLLRTVLREVKEYQTLPRVYRLLIKLQAEPEKFLEYVEGIGDRELIQEIKAFVAEEPKQKSGVIATVKAALQRYGSDPTISLVSSFDSLDLHMLRKQRMALYVSIPANNHEYYLTPNSIFWSVLFDQLMQTTHEASPVSVFCLLDEIGWLRIPQLPTILAVARKYFGILLAVQNREQLQSLYDENGATTIESNCNAKLYLTGQNYKLAKDLEQMLGKVEYTPGQIASLMDAISIRMLSQYYAILLYGNKPPIRFELVPFYANKQFAKYAKYSRNNIPVGVMKHPAAQPSKQLSNLTQADHE